MHGHFKLTPASVVRGQPLSESAPSSVDPRRLWSVFLRRWQVVLGATAVVAVLVAVWLLQTTPIYTASTQVLIDPRKERILKDEAVISELGSTPARSRPKCRSCSRSRSRDALSSGSSSPSIPCSGVPSPASASQDG